MYNNRDRPMMVILPVPVDAAGNMTGNALGNGLGNINDDIMHLFGLLPIGPGQTAATKFAEFKKLIEDTARAGAVGAIPTIKLEVKKTVTPLVITSLAAGFIGLVLSVFALRTARRAGHAGRVTG